LPGGADAAEGGLTLAWTSADLEACDAAIRQAMTGQTVSFADRSWTSQDLDKLRALRASIAAEVNASTYPRARWAAVSKGV
jgi:hypothetical protein